MGLYTILKPCLKNENTNITKNYLKFNFFPKIEISFKKLKIFSGEVSLNNMRSDLAVKWLSLISIKSKQAKHALWLNDYHIRCTLAAPHPSVKRNE